MKYDITYPNLIDKKLGCALHPLRLLNLGDLLMAGPVVSTLAP